MQGMVAIGDVGVVVVVRQSAGYDAMRGVKFYLFGSLSATKLQGMEAVGDVVVVVVVRQSARYDAMRCVKCYLFGSISVAVVVAVVVAVDVNSAECFRNWEDS